MARGDSIIRVSIIGDATKLVGALGDANKATGGLLKSAGKVLLAGATVRKGFDIVGDALDNADKFSDALDRIKGVTSPEFAKAIKDIAFDFTSIGLSAPEVADLAASFASFATSAKVSQPTIEKLTPDMLKIAAAVAATTGKTVDEVIADIGAAASGNQKPMKDYGVIVQGALNPDARILDILDQLKAKFPDVVQATSDLAGKQDELNAKWENLTTKIGGPLSDLLATVVGFIDDEIDALPSAIQGFEDLGGVFGELLSPLARLADALSGVLAQFAAVKALAAENAGLGFHNPIQGNSGLNDRAVSEAQRRQNERNGLTSRVGGP